MTGLRRSLVRLAVSVVAACGLLGVLMPSAAVAQTEPITDDPTVKTVMAIVEDPAGWAEELQDFLDTFVPAGMDFLMYAVDQMAGSAMSLVDVYADGVHELVDPIAADPAGYAQERGREVQDAVQGKIDETVGTVTGEVDWAVKTVEPVVELAETEAGNLVDNTTDGAASTVAHTLATRDRCTFSLDSTMWDTTGTDNTPIVPIALAGPLQCTRTFAVDTSQIGESHSGTITLTGFAGPRPWNGCTPGWDCRYWSMNALWGDQAHDGQLSLAGDGLGTTEFHWAGNAGLPGLTSQTSMRFYEGDYWNSGEQIGDAKYTVFDIDRSDDRWPNNSARDVTSLHIEGDITLTRVPPKP